MSMFIKKKHQITGKQKEIPYDISFGIYLLRHIRGADKAMYLGAAGVKNRKYIPSESPRSHITVVHSI